MAKPFRLATVLRVRRVQEDMAKQALAVANRSLMDAQGERDRRVDHYRSMTVPTGERSFYEFLQEEQAMRLAADSVGFSVRIVTEAEAMTARRRDEFLAARKQVRVLEKLEARRRSETLLAEDRQAAKAVDDIVTTRWAGRMAMSSAGRARQGGAG